jgi:hypothetical protein
LSGFYISLVSAFKAQPGARSRIMPFMVESLAEMITTPITAIRAASANRASVTRIGLSVFNRIAKIHGRHV